MHEFKIRSSPRKPFYDDGHVILHLGKHGECVGIFPRQQCITDAAFEAAVTEIRNHLASSNVVVTSSIEFEYDEFLNACVCIFYYQNSLTK